jgi:hypothetical protein
MKFQIFALALLFAACSSEKPAETAESRANLFVFSIINQNPQTFWESLDSPSKAAIAAIAGVSVEAPNASEKALALSGRWRRLFEIKPIKAKTAAEATEATVTVESLAGEKMELQMIKQGERWLVHLPIEPQTTPSEAPASAAASAPASAPVK